MLQEARKYESAPFTSVGVGFGMVEEESEMKTTKKTMVLIISTLLAALLAACGSSNATSSSSRSEVSSSSKSEQVEVKTPDLVGRGCDEAVSELNTAGLEAEPVSDSGKMVLDYSNWMVVEQNPEAGTALKSGDTVKLRVTKGKADGEDISVPELVGKNCAEASADLDYLGLKVEISSDSGKAVIDKSNWTVIEQKPAAGDVAREGSVVELVVTKGESESEKSGGSGEASQKEKVKEDQSQSVPKEYKTALNKAEQYSSMMHMSKQGIYDQLTSEYGERYTAEAAQYAVDNMTADWNANALAKAKDYQDMMDMSPAAIYDQLVSDYGEKFTPEEAQYAIDNL